MLANVFAIMSFVVTWFATAVLLSYRSRRIGRIKYWVIIALPLIYFLSQFISSITDEFAPLISSDSVTFASHNAYFQRMHPIRIRILEYSKNCMIQLGF